ncbi:hypothetical protein YPPY66_0452, partial [Yersinia pestis PY-66]|jgi:hypothetical protein
MY